jgi:hypothetical protein
VDAIGDDAIDVHVTRMFLTTNIRPTFSLSCEEDEEEEGRKRERKRRPC